MAATKTGPDDVGCIVWALGEFFFFFFFIFFATNKNFIAYISSNIQTEEQWKVATTKTGSNNAYGIV